MFDKCVKKITATFREKNEISQILSEVKKLSLYIYRITALLVSLESEVKMF